ncbi:MAG: hypothetical protein ABIO94_01990 [Opitutaceae bacterium]
MKLSRTFFTAALAACFVTGCATTETAVATDASPVGTWTDLHHPYTGGWTKTFLVIENVDGKLTGTRRSETMPGDLNPESFEGSRRIPELKKSPVETIPDVMFEDGVISFKIENTMSNGRARVQTYRGKVEGDKIKGVSTTTFEGLDRFGQPRKPITLDWVMKRAK